MNTESILEAAGRMSKNKIIMDFCYDEAYEKVAADMQALGFSCTAKAVRIIARRYKNIMDRVDQYAMIGLAACGSKGLEQQPA
jgi:hypothetical protein